VSGLPSQWVQTRYQQVFFAIGRDACTGNMNLEAAGVAVNPKCALPCVECITVVTHCHATLRNGKVLANELEQTNVPHIYAVGDVLDGKPELTPVAIQAGVLLARRLLAGAVAPMDYQHVCTTVFTPLEYGCCGLSEVREVE